jgi:Fe-S oxidoreductase
MRKVVEREYSFWGKFKSALGLSAPITESDLKDWEELVYDGCSMCSRCSMVCPIGIDIAYVIRKVKEGLAAAGYSPEDLKDAAGRALEFGSPMGVTLHTLQATLRVQEKETGVPITMDSKGADYLCLFSSGEIAGFPEFIGSIARIFKQAGISWTISSDYFEATNTGVQIGNTGIARQLVERVVAAAEKLGVKYVIMPECGHAYSTLRWDAPNMLGRPLPFGVIHILELLEQLAEAGRIQTRGGTDARLTYHDPCNISRRGGVIGEPRSLLGRVAPNFVDMTEHGSMNWCCGGGGGVSANSRADDLRRKVFAVKKRQLDELGVDTLVTACSNCRHMLEDGLEDNEMDIELIGLTELVAEYLVEEDQPTPAPAH